MAMYQDDSTKGFPKTLLIRNTVEGMVWQVYHVDNEEQAYYLSKGAKDNGFQGRTLVDHTGDEETFPNWRMETARGLVKLLPDYLAIKEGAKNIPTDN